MLVVPMLFWCSWGVIEKHLCSGRQIYRDGAPSLGARHGHYPHLPDPMLDTANVTEFP